MKSLAGSNIFLQARFHGLCAAESCVRVQADPPLAPGPGWMGPCGVTEIYSIDLCDLSLGAALAMISHRRAFMP